MAILAFLFALFALAVILISAVAAGGQWKPALPTWYAIVPKGVGECASKGICTDEAAAPQEPSVQKPSTGGFDPGAFTFLCFLILLRAVSSVPF